MSPNPTISRGEVDGSTVVAAARAEAEKSWPKQRTGVHVNPSLIRDEFVRGAKFGYAARAAEQPSEEQVERAAIAAFLSIGRLLRRST